MGDTTTHKEIALQIIAVLQSGRPNNNFYFFELGNWLTDMSQMRDPTAMVGAKCSIWNQQAAWYSPVVHDAIADLDGYLDDLMGKPAGEDGLLTKWLRDVVFAYGNEVFRQNGITPERFEEIFRQFYTQYYPHEHVDFPPWPVHDIIGDRSPSQWAQHECSKPPTKGSGRGLYQYTEEQLEYLSDLLTVIDQKWAKLPDQPEASKEQEELLVQYGHASHALEDFFFHSNFVERAWLETKQPLPWGTEDEEQHGSEPDGHDHEEAGPRNRVREQRVFYRRLRAPVGKGDVLSTETSNPMDRVYTGFFGSKDVFHTVIDGLKGIRAAANDKAGGGGMYSGLLAFVQGEHPSDETPEQRKQRRKDELARHKEALFTGLYETGARKEMEAGRLHKKSYDAICRACEMDRNLWKEYSLIDLGVSGMIKTLIEMAEDEYRVASARRTELDTQGLTADDRTDNGASNEMVGSHSLMSKDSERKHPLRSEAYNVASASAVYVAKRMVENTRTRVRAARSVNEAPARADGGSSNTAAVTSIDWLHVLQHFAAHPLESEAVGGEPWWKAQFSAADATKTGHVLRFIDEATIQQRMQEENKKRLAKKYDDLAADWEKEWRHIMGKSTGALVGMAVGAVAGAVAGAMLGAAIGGVGGAILGGILGAIGGAVIGGVLGSLIGGLFN